MLAHSGGFGPRVVDVEQRAIYPPLPSRGRPAQGWSLSRDGHHVEGNVLAEIRDTLEGRARAVGCLRVTSDLLQPHLRELMPIRK